MGMRSPPFVGVHARAGSRSPLVVTMWTRRSTSGAGRTQGRGRRIFSACRIADLFFLHIFPPRADQSALADSSISSLKYFLTGDSRISRIRSSLGFGLDEQESYKQRPCPRMAKIKHPVRSSARGPVERVPRTEESFLSSAPPASGGSVVAEWPVFLP